MRGALPDLRGKDVVLGRIIRQQGSEDTYAVRLVIDGLHYQVTTRAKDELGVISWLLRLQAKKGTRDAEA